VIVVNPDRDRIIIPRPTPIRGDYEIKSVDIQADIRDQSAQVQVSQVFANKSSRTLQASLFFPLPDEASISGLTLIVDGKELPGRLLPKDEARKIYEDIVRRSQDPALLEYMGRGLFRTSVFPVPPNAERKVEIRYTHILRQKDGLIDFTLPLGHSKHSSHPIQTLNLTVRVQAAEAIKTVYSPTHKVEIERPDSNRAVCKATLHKVSTADDFRLLYGAEQGPVGMNLISYRPDQSEEGYFLLLAAPDIKPVDAKPVPKTVVFVVDRSGSMSGKKFEQAREALRFVLDRLQPEDLFNIVAYDSKVESFAEELQRADEGTLQKARGFIDGLYAGGGTNIDGALQKTLPTLQDGERPNYVLFLTDGLPTVGETNDVKITANAVAANQVGARLFNFGVGFDVNSRLLDRLSREQRGQSIYVRPNEDIETQVAALYNRIGSPVLTDMVIDFEFDEAPQPSSPAAIARTYPRELTDLYRGDQLIWVGRYRQNGPVKIRLKGNVSGEEREYKFTATLTDHSPNETNGFVEKLWATRRVGEIIDELDLQGHNQELVDELVKLSIQHGIMTPYTSFLAEEETELLANQDNVRRAGENLTTGLRDRVTGQDSFELRRQKAELKSADGPDLEFTRRTDIIRRRTYAPRDFGQGGDRGRGIRRGGRAPLPSEEDEDLAKAKDNSIRYIGQKTFFQRKGLWRDSTVTPEQEKAAVDIELFSDAYFELAARHGKTLGKYFVFQEPVLINLGDKTYRIKPADEEKR